MHDSKFYSVLIIRVKPHQTHFVPVKTVKTKTDYNAISGKWSTAVKLGRPRATKYARAM